MNFETDLSHPHANKTAGLWVYEVCVVPIYMMATTLISTRIVRADVTQRSFPLRRLSPLTSIYHCNCDILPHRYAHGIPLPCGQLCALSRRAHSSIVQAHTSPDHLSVVTTPASCDISSFPTSASTDTFSFLTSLIPPPAIRSLRLDFRYGIVDERYGKSPESAFLPTYLATPIVGPKSSDGLSWWSHPECYRICSIETESQKRGTERFSNPVLQLGQVASTYEDGHRLEIGCWCSCVWFRLGPWRSLPRACDSRR